MPPKKFPFTQAFLRSRLRYDAKTGLFFWRNSDKVAGTLQGGGYIHINIDGSKYLAHRLAWFYVYSEEPAMVDHKDKIRNHNWLDNLRAATRSENQQNTGLGICNTSGFKGVYKSGDKWRAQITLNGVRYRLGYFDSAEEAGAAYIKTAKKLHKNSPYYRRRFRPMPPPMQKPSHGIQVRHG